MKSVSEGAGSWLTGRIGAASGHWKSARVAAKSDGSGHGQL